MGTKKSIESHGCVNSQQFSVSTFLSVSYQNEFWLTLSFLFSYQGVNLPSKIWVWSQVQLFSRYQSFPLFFFFFYLDYNQLPNVSFSFYLLSPSLPRSLFCASEHTRVWETRSISASRCLPDGKLCHQRPWIWRRRSPRADAAADVFYTGGTLAVFGVGNG